MAISPVLWGGARVRARGREAYTLEETARPLPRRAISGERDVISGARDHDAHEDAGAPLGRDPTAQQLLEQILVKLPSY